MQPTTQSFGPSHENAVASVETYLRDLGADAQRAREKAVHLVSHARETVVRQEPARSWWSLALRGILAIVAGAIFLSRPVESIVTIVTILGAWILVDGIIAIVSAISHRAWASVPVGAIGALIGYLILSRTTAATIVFFVLTAAWALARGAGELGMAARMQRHEPGRKSLVFLGASSFAFGLLLLIAPMAGVITLGWWVGMYAVIYGVISLVRMFEVRHLTDEEKDEWLPRSHLAAHPA